MSNAPTHAAGEELVNRDKKAMHEEPDIWRNNVKSFLSDATADEKRGARRELQQNAKSFTKVNTIKSHLKKKTGLQLRRRHFRKHFKSWEDGDTADADEEFDRLKAEQNNEYEFSNGESGVETEEVGRRREEITGTEKRHGFCIPLDPTP